MRINCDGCGAVLALKAAATRGFARCVRCSDLIPLGERESFTSGQIVLSSFLFGPLAGAGLAAINDARAGKRASCVATLLLGFLAFLVQAFLLVAVLPEAPAGLLGLLMSTGIGAIFAAAQRGTGARKGAIGVLLLTGLSALAVEFVILFGLVAFLG